MALPVGILECRALVIQGQQQPRRFAIDRDIIRVGRGVECEIQIDDLAMGRRHCRLVRTDRRVAVEDDSSPGGTYLNNEGRIGKPEPLRIGDVVHFGARRTSIHFEHRGRPEHGREPHPLLAAICADPRDEAPRIVYADWLADRGDPRGELIHYQVGAEHLPSRDPRRTDLKAQAWALLARHEPAWILPLPRFVEAWRFRHGFLSAVLMEPRAILDTDDLAALRRVHPIRAVGVTGFPSPELLERLAGSPRLDGITQVELQFALDHEALAARFGRGERAGIFGPERRYFTAPRRRA
jgi:uncharacterized protein (TIGR02996 family)